MNKENEKISVEEVHKEIDLIQACIARMAQNSFAIKAWFVSLYAVILALLPEKVNLFLLCSALVAINLIFWYLDGFFLRTEKVYRKMYDWVLVERPQNNRELLYQLNPVAFNGKIRETESVGQVMLSKTLLWFYLIPLIFVVIVFICNCLHIICSILQTYCAT